MGLCSSSLYSIWVRLELNIIIFLALCITSYSTPTREVLLKYFIIQAFRTAVFLWFFFVKCLAFSSRFSETGLLIAILVKLGVPPFHNWVISIIISLRWGLIFLISTIQKVLPILMLVFIELRNSLSLLIFTGAILVVINTLSINSLKTGLAFSSVFSGLWVIAGAPSISKRVLFIVLYGMALAALMVFISSWNRSYKLSYRIGFNSRFLGGFFPCMLLLNLGGMPPFAGFWGKVIILLEVLNNYVFLTAFILTISSVYLIYLYLKVGLHFFTLRGKLGLIPSKLEEKSRVGIFLLVSPLLFLFYI